MRTTGFDAAAATGGSAAVETIAAAADDAVQAEVGDDPVERVQPDVPAGDVPSEAAEEQALTAEPAVEGSELGGAVDDPASEPT